ncbi:MAG: uroporphyrinogen decarboxylase family protein [Sedimentisphaeraceae bacterium JB056]
MESKEIVRRAIEFDNPPRLPFFIGGMWNDHFKRKNMDIPNDVLDCWEMDRQKAGWFFDNPVEDDWGCGWGKTALDNIGQVVSHPLSDWKAFDSFIPPSPHEEFYYERIEEHIKDAGDKYVMLTSHFNFIERFEMLRGFDNALIDFYTEPEKTNKLLDMVLEFKLGLIEETAKRFGDRVNGFFMTDDWGTQENTYISVDLFKEYFYDRYKILTDAMHSHGYHFILHSCGKINQFVPVFAEIGIDMLNMGQPKCYGIEELGEIARGKIAFLATCDIQATLPKGDPDEIKQEALDLVKNWSTPEGGFVVFNYGDPEAIGSTNEIAEIMFEAFDDLKYYWKDK